MRSQVRSIALVLAATALVSCAGKHPPSTSRPPQRTPPPPSGKPGKVFERGKASWYGPGFHGNRTANGEVYDQYAMTAAHKTLPFDTHVEVRNLDNGRTTVVRINDRGPFVHGRIIDLSRAGARVIDMEVAGVANVELRLLGRSHEAPREDVPPPRMEPVDPEAGEFDVQIGAFADPANAYRLRQRMLQTWPAVHVVRYVDPRSGQEFHRVRIGPLDGSGRATEAKLQLEEEGFDPYIVRHDPNE